LGFNKSVFNSILYYKTANGESLILVLYVDDLFLTDRESLIVECKYSLAFNFEMKDLDMMHYLSRLEVWKRTDEILLSQGKHIVDILNKFKILNLKPMAIPMMMNLRKINMSSSNSNEIDPNLYRQLIG
jgi:hypothetical protein